MSSDSQITISTNVTQPPGADIFRSKNWPWYKSPTELHLNAVVRQIFEGYNHIPSAEIESHILHIVRCFFPSRHNIHLLPPCFSQLTPFPARRGLGNLPVAMFRRILVRIVWSRSPSKVFFTCLPFERSRGGWQHTTPTPRLGYLHGARFRQTAL